MYVHTYIHTCVHAYISVYMSTHSKHIHNTMHIYIHIYIHSYIHTHITQITMHMYIRAYIHAHITQVTIEDIGIVNNVRLGVSKLKWPLFKLELILNSDGTVDIGSNGVPIPFDKFVEMPLALFDKALASVSDIPQLEPTVVDKIFWSSKPILASVHAEEKHAKELREKMKSALTKALEPMRQYIHRFEEFRDILNTVGRLCVRLHTHIHTHTRTHTGTCGVRCRAPT
jgi:hypothetical protein